MSSTSIHTSNKVYDFFNRYALNQDDSDAMANELFFDDVIYHTSFGSALGKTGIKAYRVEWFNFFEHVDFKITDAIVHQRFITYHFTEQFKHVETFNQIAPTGRVIENVGVVNFMLCKDKVLNCHIANDMPSIYAQLLGYHPEQTHTIADTPIITNQYMLLFESVLHKLKGDGIHLSIRKLECLSLWLNGKSDSEIGDILKLSKRTVHYHQDKLKSVFGCYTKAHLLREIKARGLEPILYECAYLLVKSKLLNLTVNTPTEHESVPPV